jgi:hypothetical protein
MLLASYPSSTPTDAETYIALVVAVFTQFELRVIDKACSPSGIPTSIAKFLPTVGEINEWCIKRAEAFRILDEHQKTRRVAAPFVPPPIKSGQISWETFTRLVEEGKTPMRPIGAFERGGYLGPTK